MACSASLSGALGGSDRAVLPLPTEVDRLVRVPFSFDHYLGLPEHHRAEYVDGAALVSPSASASHQRVSRRLANLIEAHCPGLFVVEAVGVWTGERRSRIPDVCATERPFDGSWSDQTPVVVVEILSPSTRQEDTSRKREEYGETGIGHYWIVDPERRTLTALVARAGAWAVALQLDDDRPRGAVGLGEPAAHGTVELDLATLLAT